MYVIVGFRKMNTLHGTVMPTFSLATGSDSDSISISDKKNIESSIYRYKISYIFVE